jgi:hypothetical protein
MNAKKLSVSLTAAVAGICLCAGISLAASSLDKIQFIKIAPLDERAVIKDADGKLRVIKTGDTIGGNVSVAGISAGRIVLEEKTDKGTETVIVRIVNGRQLIERINKQAEVRPVQGASQPAANKASAAKQ